MKNGAMPAMSGLVNVSLPCSRWIAPPYPVHRTDDELLQDRPVDIRKPLDVQARLSHPVLAKLGQEGSLLRPFRQQVDHQFPATDGKARQEGFPRSSTLIGVPV